MEIKMHDNGAYVSLEPIGRIDTNTAPDFEKELLNILEKKRNCLVNMGEVPYISSAGLRVIMMAAKASKNANCKFLLCNNQQAVKEILEISGFDKILNIYENVDEAMEALSV